MMSKLHSRLPKRGGDVARAPREEATLGLRKRFCKYGRQVSIHFLKQKLKLVERSECLATVLDSSASVSSPFSLLLL